MLPPGPRLPKLVQTLGFLLAGRRFLDATRRRYGDVVTMSTAFDSKFVMVFDPDLLKRVFQAPPDRLCSLPRPTTSVAAPRASDDRPPAGAEVCGRHPSGTQEHPA